MAKIKIQKKKKVTANVKVENEKLNEEVALPSTRKSDEPILNKVRKTFLANESFKSTINL